MNNLFNCQCNDNNHEYNSLFDPKEAFMLGNLFKNLYMSFHGFSNYFFQGDNPRVNLLTEYQIYAFVAHELNLYLDTHPHDKNMIQLFNQFNKRKKELLKEYESKFGLLYVDSNYCDHDFTWINSPWPWECIS